MSRSDLATCLARLEDMRLFSLKVLRYTRGLSESDFFKNEIVLDATLRNIELIGEAASKIPHDIREQFPYLPWRQVICTRQHLIHVYMSIDQDTVWDIVSIDIPELLPMLNGAIETLKTRINTNR